MQAGDDDLVMFKNIYVKLGEDVNSVVIAKFSCGDEGAFVDVVEDVGVFHFGRKFFDIFKVAHKLGLMTLPVAT